MEINTNILKSFLKKVSLNNTISEFVADFRADGVYIIVNNPENTVIIDAKLNAGCFVNYEALGKVGVMNLDKVIMILNGFDDMIKLSVEGNLLIFKSGNRTVETELANIETIDVPGFDINKFKDVYPVKISSSWFNSLINDININKDYTLRIKTEKDKFIINNSGTFRFTEVLEIKDIVEGYHVSFGEPIINAMKNLTDDVEFNIKTDFPAVIKENTQDSDITIVVAPRIEDN